MEQEDVEELLSSKTRTRIEHLISIRPRTLGELAELTGISIQAVLKHISKLESMGLVEERRLTGGKLSVRKVYAAKSYVLGDYSTPDLTITKFSKTSRRPPPGRGEKADLESMAEDAMLLRSRVRDEARRLGRVIDELADEQARLSETLVSMGLEEEERLILEVLFTEDSEEKGMELLARHYGLRDGRRSIDRALSKANRNARGQKTGHGDQR